MSTFIMGLKHVNKQILQQIMVDSLCMQIEDLHNGAHLLFCFVFLQGGDFPFKKVLYANIGNPQEVGQRPITIVRQVAAACLDPSLLEQGVYPSDVVQRAREILADAKGSSLGESAV